MKIWQDNDVVNTPDANRWESRSASVGLVVTADTNEIIFTTDRLKTSVNSGQIVAITTTADLTNPTLTIVDVDTGTNIITNAEIKIVSDDTTTDTTIPTGVTVISVYDSDNNTFWVPVTNPSSSFDKGGTLNGNLIFNNTELEENISYGVEFVTKNADDTTNNLKIMMQGTDLIVIDTNTDAVVATLSDLTSVLQSLTNRVAALEGGSFDGYINDNLTVQGEFIPVGTRAELEAIRDRINAGELGLNVRLTADIDLEGSQDNQWTPIGDFDNRYNGVFDGSNYTISNLFINDYTLNYQGLFGYSDNNSVIKNLILEGSYINANSFISAIVGVNDGNIINVHVNNTQIIGTAPVGVIAGSKRGNIYASWVNNIRITTKSSDAIVGGIVGLNTDGNIIASYVNNIDITADGSLERVGAIVGDSTSGSLSANYYVADADIGTNPEGVIRVPDIATLNVAVPVMNEQLVNTPYQYQAGGIPATQIPTVVEQPHISTDLISIGSGKIVDNEGNDIVALAKNGGGGEPADYAEVKALAQGALQRTGGTVSGTVVVGNKEWNLVGTRAELEAIRDRINAGELDLNVVLTANIDLQGSEENQWTPISDRALYVYSGIFDGNNHTISNLYINDSMADYQGLFGYIGNSVIKNLKVKNVEITAKDNVGAVVGNNFGGNIINVHVDNATIVGNNLVGAVAGTNGGFLLTQLYGKIYASSINNAVLTVIDNTPYVGGITSGGAINCVVTASYVNNITIVSTGDSTNVGGVVGSTTGTFSANYYVADADIGTNPEGVTRVTTIQALNDNVSDMNSTLTDTSYQYETGATPATDLPTVVEEVRVETPTLVLGGDKVRTAVMNVVYEDETTETFNLLVK